MNFKELIKSMVENLAYDIVKSILLIVFSSGLTFPVAYKSLSELEKAPDAKWLIILSISITAIAAFVVLVLYQYFSVKYFAMRKVESNYHILKKIVTFEYNGKKSNYKSEITLKLNTHSREYYGKYYWSGSGKGNISVQENGYSLEILKQRSRYIEYVVIFDKAYKKNSTLTFTIIGDMEDPDGNLSPYFATTVDVPTKELEIVLNIPLTYKAQNFEKEIIPPHMHNHEESENFNLDANGIYVWKINRPKLSYQYSLNWEFK